MTPFVEHAGGAYRFRSVPSDRDAPVMMTTSGGSLSAGSQLSSSTTREGRKMRQGKSEEVLRQWIPSQYIIPTLEGTKQQAKVLVGRPAGAANQERRPLPAQHNLARTADGGAG